MPDGFASIGEIINNEPALRQIKNLIRAGDVVSDFFKIFPELERNVKPVKTEKKVLYLSVENSVLRNELKFRENLIVEKVNKYFSENIIKSIRFVSK
jgi:Dna[CI] antecedent, DciA